MKTAEEHLNLFIETLRSKDEVLQSDVKKLITKTQQEKNVIVGQTSVEGIINGLYSLLQQATEVKVKEKISTNQVMKDFNILMHNKEGQVVNMQCRLIKESAWHKTDIEGEWGVNMSSFKRLD